jgi:quinol monooxygenase YgiN
MFARYTTVRGDPNKIDATVDYVDGNARDAVQATEGNCGFAVLVDPDAGRVVGASYWDSAESMAASEAGLAATRSAAAAVLGGEVSIERFEVAVGFRHSIPARGALCRLSRLQVDLDQVNEVVTLMQQESLPRIKGSAGLCSFQLLLNRETGAGLVVSSWDSQAAADAFWPTAQELRTRASELSSVRFSDPENLTMIRTTVRLED